MCSESGIKLTSQLKQLWNSLSRLPSSSSSFYINSSFSPFLPDYPSNACVLDISYILWPARWLLMFILAIRFSIQFSYFNLLVYILHFAFFFNVFISYQQFPFSTVGVPFICTPFLCCLLRQEICNYVQPHKSIICVVTFYLLFILSITPNITRDLHLIPVNRVTGY